MQTPFRRAAVACCAVFVAALLLRPQISEAIVVRGDDLSYRGEMRRAHRMYERALVLDSGNAVALDRLAFEAIRGGRPEAMGSMIARLAAARIESDPMLVEDRAMLELKAHRYADAERDFRAYAQHVKDARASTFAGWSAARAGRRELAIGDFTLALTYDPSFTPARSALHRIAR